MASKSAKKRKRLEVYGAPKPTFAVWAATLVDPHLRSLYTRVPSNLRVAIAFETAHHRLRISAAYVIRRMRQTKIL
jgi:hypothetical protein